MIKNISKYYYSAVAFVMSFCVNFFAEMDAVIAASSAPEYVCGTIGSHISYTASCNRPNYECSTAGNYCASYGKSGWQCSTSAQYGGGSCECSSYIQIDPVAVRTEMECGYGYKCVVDGSVYESISSLIGAGSGSSASTGILGSIDNNSIRTAYCNTTGSAGYRSYNGANQTCVCCPRGDFISESSKSIFSNYNAAAVSDCYITGIFADETGVFEYTNEDKCYYAS